MQRFNIFRYPIQSLFESRDDQLNPTKSEQVRKKIEKKRCTKGKSQTDAPSGAASTGHLDGRSYGGGSIRLAV